MQYKISVTNGNGEQDIKLVDESEYRQWIRSQFKGQMNGHMLEQYIEKRVMDVKYQRRPDHYRY